MENRRRVKNAVVKSSGDKIEVYQLTEGFPTPEHIYCLFLGDKMSMTAVNQDKHQKTYTAKELTVEK